MARECYGRIGRRRLSLVLLVGFVAALFGADAPALAQSSGPVSLGKMFEPDLPDLTPQGLQKLKEAVKEAKNAQQDCYPLRAAFRVFAGRGMGDPSFQQPLAEARDEEIEKALRGLGLADGQFKTDWGFGKADRDGDVQVTYGPFASEQAEGPVLEVHSKPTKGTKVSRGQQIEVTIKASERYQDGYKSWPSGVQVIQLLTTTDDGSVNGLVKSQDYGKRPPPCAVRTESWVYPVPDDPPPIVHLLAETEDGAGNKATKPAELPTGDWYGTIKAHAQGTIYNDSALVEFAFDVAADGTVKGKGRTKMTNAPQHYSTVTTSGDCTYTYPGTPDEFDVDIGGRHDAGEFKLQLSTKVLATYQLTF